MKQLRLLPETKRDAVFNAERTHRYSLLIRWDEGDVINFLMANPSQADERVNDPTVERCQRRAQKLGYAGLVVTNLFAFRSTDPKALDTCDDPVGGSLNDEWIIRHATQSARVIVAWGMIGQKFDRATHVMKLLDQHGVKPYCLGTCQNGSPMHPLYRPMSFQPIPYQLGGK